MKKSRHSPEQGASALRQSEKGMPVREDCRKMGISEPTLHLGTKKFQGMSPGEVRRLWVLEDENLKLKRLVDDQTGDKQLL